MYKSTKGESVSAVMAVYNPDLCFFEKAVASVLSQTFSVLELLLVNDGGSEAFRTLLPDDSRIRVFSKKNEGVAATRNFALQQCRGEYIAFLDQDDYWYPDKLHEQMAMIPVPGEPCMVTSLVDIVEKNDIIQCKPSKKAADLYRLKSRKGSALLNLVEDNFLYSSTPLIHSSVFDRIGGFDLRTQPHDDWDMYLRVMLAGFPAYFYQQKPLSVWRQHDDNESNNDGVMARSKCRVEKKLLDTVTDERIRSITAINLLIDSMERVNLLYRMQQYKRFRALIKGYLLRLLRYNHYSIKSGVVLHRTISRRIRKIRYKSVRRYVVSFFLT